MKQDASFDRKRHIFGAIMGPLCALLIWVTPIESLTPEQHRLLAVMALVAIWWITEPVAIPVTSLLGPTLCVLVGVAPMKTAFDSFANPMIFLFMGGFLIAKGMMVNGLDKRIAYGIMSMKWVGDSPRRIFIAMGVACMICSGWISNTATAAMMFPIALGLLEAIREMMAANGKKIDLSSYKYATGLMLMTAYACSIGGVLTPIGTPPNIIMLGFLGELAPQAPQVSFFDWMVWGFVAMVAYFVVAYVVLWKMFPADVEHIDGAHEFIERHAKELGRWTRAQKNTLFCFGLAVVIWVAPGILSMLYGSDSGVVKEFNKFLPEEMAAMIGGLLLFFLPVNTKTGEMTLSWKDGCAGIEWGTLLLFGGGIRLDNEFYALADALASPIGNLTEELHHLVSLKGSEADFVFERSHIEHIAIGDIALRQGGADASHIVDCQYGLLIVILGRPDEDVGEKVGEIALRALGSHIVSHLTNDGPHDGVVHTFVWLKELHSSLIGLLVIPAVDDDPGTLHTHQLVVLGRARSHQHRCHNTKK